MACYSLFKQERSTRCMGQNNTIWLFVQCSRSGGGVGNRGVDSTSRPRKISAPVSMNGARPQLNVRFPRARSYSCTRGASVVVKVARAIY